MPGQDPPLKLLINLMKAALEALKFLQEYSILLSHYLQDLGKRLYEYFNKLDEEIRQQCNLPKKYKHKPKSQYIPSLFTQKGKYCLWDTLFKVQMNI